MKKQILLPMAAILLACPAWAASQSGIALSPSALTFNGSSGNVTAQSVTVKSTGTAPLVITALSTTIRNFAIVTFKLPATVEPGKTTKIGIRAKPGATEITGTLNITSNAGNPKVALTETAIAKQTAHSVALTWKAPGNGTVDSYQVDRAAAGSSTWSVVGNTGASTLNWTDTSVQAGKKYTYEVTALDDTGAKSGPSNQFTATIP